MRNSFQQPLRIALWTGLLIIGSVLVNLLSSSNSNADSDADHLRRFNSNYQVFSLTIPNELSFCGEAVPLERLDVRERLDRELLVNTYWQSNTLLAHKRAARWFPLIEAILLREGVPDDMKYLALIESGFTNTVSPSGAAGYWQFLKETGASYGLEVNNEVDERYHVEKSTEAACRYLQAAQAKFGSWTLAAAAYNMGPGGVGKQIERQHRNDYYDLLLPEETSRYLFRILAMKEIIRDPERYGFHIRDKDLYAPYRTRAVDVNGSIPDLALFAIEQGSDHKTLRLLNPWLRENGLTNKSGRTYRLLLPAEGFNSFEP